jgi:hypothetical protein
VKKTREYDGVTYPDTHPNRHGPRGSVMGTTHRAVHNLPDSGLWLYRAAWSAKLLMVQNHRLVQRRVGVAQYLLGTGVC